VGEREEELRKHRRVAYHEKVLINDSLEVQCNDLSEGGIFVHTSRALLPGSEVSITFPETGLKVTAVVKVVPSSGGLGLMFKNLDQAQATQVSELIWLATEQGRLIRSEKTTVLIVEDCVQGECYRKKLSAEGYHVIRASTGAEAVKMLDTQAPDAVVLDLKSKGIDGFEVLEAIKASDKLKGVPVLAYTSSFSQDEKSRAVQSGAETLLPKETTSPAKLAAILSKILNR
jgi:CheY-like chemotaxis protein